MKRFALIVLLAGCGQIELPSLGGVPEAEPDIEAPLDTDEDVAAPADAVRPQPRPEDLDTDEAAEEPATDAALEPAAAPAAPSAGGTTLVTLGDVTQPGLWIKTPLVGAERQGRAQNAATGQAVTLTLIPIDGPATAGSRASLQAMQGLGLNLTDIAEVRITPL